MSFRLLFPVLLLIVASFHGLPKRPDWLPAPTASCQGVFNVLCSHPYWSSPALPSRNHVILHCSFQTTVTLDVAKTSTFPVIPGHFRFQFSPIFRSCNMSAFFTFLVLAILRTFL